MAAKEKTKSLSVRRNRDYISYFAWSHELNRDVYQSYAPVKQNSEIGFMKRMKQYREDLHQELKNFNEKQLWQQGTFAESEG